MTDVDYVERARMYRPRDPEQLAAEIRRLHLAHGWTPRDLAHALNVRPDVVMLALRTGPRVEDSRDGTR
jgi:hypothetical protein